MSRSRESAGQRESEREREKKEKLTRATAVAKKAAKYESTVFVSMAAVDGQGGDLSSSRDVFGVC